MQEITSIHFIEIEQDIKLQENIDKVIKRCFEEEKLLNLNIYISITLTNSKQIKKLNNEYRNIDKETDVLSFPMFQKEEIENITKNQIKSPITEILGDIIISVEKVREQAIEYSHSFERELSYMLVHGFYHLMGYDHIEEKDKKVMRTKEEKILEDLKILR